jgi:hypothetical protein
MMVVFCLLYQYAVFGFPVFLFGYGLIKLFQKPMGLPAQAEGKPQHAVHHVYRPAV